MGLCPQAPGGVAPPASFSLGCGGDVLPFLPTTVNSALAPRLPDDLARPHARPGFLAGAGALFSGFGFVLRTPAVWPLAMVPVAVGVGVTALLGGGALHLLVPAIARVFGPRWGFVATLADVVVGALALLLAALVGFGVAQPISGPALNGIVRRVEADLGAPARPPSSFAEDAGRALQSIAVSYAFGMPILAILLVIGFLFPPATVVTFPVKLVVLALLVSWDLCDYPLSTRGVPVGRRIAFMARNAPAMIGFGFGLALLSLVPCAMVVVLPVGVAGAARLTRRIELFEQRRERAPDG
jgi:CysZ protein